MLKYYVITAQNCVPSTIKTSISSTIYKALQFMPYFTIPLH